MLCFAPWRNFQQPTNFIITIIFNIIPPLFPPMYPTSAQLRHSPFVHNAKQHCSSNDIRPSLSVPSHSTTDCLVRPIATCWQHGDFPELHVWRAAWQTDLPTFPGQFAASVFSVSGQRSEKYIPIYQITRCRTIERPILNMLHFNCKFIEKRWENKWSGWGRNKDINNAGQRIEVVWAFAVNGSRWIVQKKHNLTPKGKWRTYVTRKKKGRGYHNWRL